MALNKNEYVIYNKAINKMMSYIHGQDIIIYNSKKEALIDCQEGEEVVNCLDLPKDQQKILLKQSDFN